MICIFEKLLRATFVVFISSQTVLGKIDIIFDDYNAKLNKDIPIFSFEDKDIRAISRKLELQRSDLANLSNGRRLLARRVTMNVVDYSSLRPDLVGVGIGKVECLPASGKESFNLTFTVSNNLYSSSVPRNAPSSTWRERWKNIALNAAGRAEFRCVRAMAYEEVRRSDQTGLKSGTGKPPERSPSTERARQRMERKEPVSDGDR